MIKLIGDDHVREACRSGYLKELGATCPPIKDALTLPYTCLIPAFTQP